MAGIPVEEGSALAQAIQSAVQAKLIENTWAAEENDTTLSEYVTMMLVNGKDFQGVQSELGGELLGIGEDDPSVVEFTGWLFGQVQAMAGPQEQAATVGQSMMDGGGQEDDGSALQGVQDSEMGDAGATATGEGVYVHHHFPSLHTRVLTLDNRPSGPKAMRNGNTAGSTGGRGRGGRMLGQMNRQMDRTQDDPLRRIKGAASGAGRIDAHNSRAPRGPRNPQQNVANGMQRMMNGRGGGPAGAMNMNPMAQAGNGLNALDSTQQMAFMQMMEMQANMMANMIQTGQMPNMGAQQNDFGGGQRGGRGRGGKSLFDRMDKRGGGRGHHHQARQQPQDGDASMDVDSSEKKGTPFDTMCKFNLGCTNPSCPFAHQSPANTRPGITVDLSDTCTHGIACTNSKCTARHPSPASRHSSSTLTNNAPYSANGKIDADCKFFPNCTAGPMCPFRHPDTRPCRNGADCTVPGCTFAHSTIPCRYNPCTRPDCPFKHAEGQKRGKFEDKVWTVSYTHLTLPTKRIV